MFTCPGVVAVVGVAFRERIFPFSQFATVGHCPFSMALILCIWEKQREEQRSFVKKKIPTVTFKVQFKPTIGITFGTRLI